MIEFLHWLASFVVLSVVLARLELIRPSMTNIHRWITSALGWSMLGLNAFATMIEPFYGHLQGINRFSLIGVALCALAYRWEGATAKAVEHRRVTDA